MAEGVAEAEEEVDARIYTNDNPALAGSLCRDASHQTAIGDSSRAESVSDSVPEKVKSQIASNEFWKEQGNGTSCRHGKFARCIAVRDRAA